MKGERVRVWCMACDRVFYDVPPEEMPFQCRLCKEYLAVPMDADIGDIDKSDAQV